MPAFFSRFTGPPILNRAYVHVGSDGRWGAGMGDTFDLDAGAVPATARWYYLVPTWDGTAARGYRDSALDFGPTPHTGLGGMPPLQLGSWDGVDELTDGVRDEIRVSNVARSPGWIAAQYSAMTGSFISLGLPQPR